MAHNVTAAFAFHSSDARRLEVVIGRIANSIKVLADSVIELDEVAAGFLDSLVARGMRGVEFIECPFKEKPTVLHPSSRQSSIHRATMAQNLYQSALIRTHEPIGAGRET